jgi:hypothetical protein
MPEISKKFEFVVSNDQPSKAASDASRRKLVRTNAKRYSLEGHALPVDSRYRTSGDIAAYTGRFHLKVVPRNENEAAGMGSVYRQDGASRLLETDNDQKRKIVVQKLQHDRSISRSLGSGRLDPFDTLVIKIGAQEELLFRHGRLVRKVQIDD